MNISLPDDPAAQLAPPDDPLARPPDAALDDLVRLAATVCAVPVAALTLDDGAQAQLAAYHGPAELAASALMLCTPSESSAAPLADEPAETDRPLHLCASLPLLSETGRTLGRLALLTPQPHTLSTAQHDTLAIIARQAATLLELRQARLLDRAMLAAVECLALVVDRDGRVVQLNRACEQFTGYSSAEIRDRLVWDVFLPASEAADAQAEFALLPPDQPRRIERSWMCKDGQLHRIGWTERALLDEQGQLRYVVSTSASVPERRRSPTIHREQTFLTAMLDNLEDGIIACDADGVITLFNRATRELYGLPSQPTPAGRWAEHFDLFQPDGRTPLPPEQIPLARALRGEPVHNVELVIAPHAGQPRTVLASGQPIIDVHGTKLGAVVALHNITERKQAEQARRTSEERLRMLISNAPVILYTLDCDGMITMSDGKGLQVMGYTPGQHVGSSVFTLFGDRDEIKDDLRRAVAGESFQTSRTVHGLSFETWYEPLRDEQGNLTGVLGISIDISDRQRIVQEQARLQEEIIRVQAATLAELSTPLIPLNDQVVVMPLVGALDPRRVQQVLDTLLQGVERSRAQVAIIDITGVPVVDTQVANVLLQAAQAVKLLGARVVLTGIRPEVAQTLVGLGVDLRTIVTRGTLQSGISYASGQR